MKILKISNRKIRGKKTRMKIRIQKLTAMLEAEKTMQEAFASLSDSEKKVYKETAAIRMPLEHKVAQAHKILAHDYAKKAVHHMSRIAKTGDNPRLDEDTYFAHFDKARPAIESAYKHNNEHKKLTGQTAIQKGSSLHKNLIKAKNHWNRLRLDKIDPNKKSED